MDDIFIDKNVASAEHIRKYFQNYGLEKEEGKKNKNGETFVQEANR